MNDKLAALLKRIQADVGHDLTISFRIDFQKAQVVGLSKYHCEAVSTMEPWHLERMMNGEGEQAYRSTVRHLKDARELWTQIHGKENN